MKDSISGGKSSLIVSVPVIAANLAACFLCAFFGISFVAMIFMLIFAIALTARLWARFSSRELSVKIRIGTKGLYPGEELKIPLELHNNKLLPVMWLRIFAPLPYNRCMEPEQIRPAEKGEIMILEELKADTGYVGEKKVSSLLWYEKRNDEFVWKANRRGICRFGDWRLVTGDGFGLVQRERPFEEAQDRIAAVYPAPADVSADIFLRTFWTSDTGRRGMIEDTTLIRSTRGYMPYDPARLINWRLLAKGQELSSNVYERILPRNIHFIFDGESFSGPDKDLPAMEKTLSVLGSLFVKLEKAGVRCGLSLPDSRNSKAVDLFGAGTEQLLFALAMYDPLEDVFSGEKHELLAQEPAFNISAILADSGRTGRFYYVCRGTGRLADSPIIRELDGSNTSVITYDRDPRFHDFETIWMGRICREGGAA